jgi:hypothetical protein
VDEMAHAWVNVTNISDADYQEWLKTHNQKAVASAAAEPADGAKQ